MARRDHPASRRESYANLKSRKVDLAIAVVAPRRVGRSECGLCVVQVSRRIQLSRGLVRLRSRGDATQGPNLIAGPIFRGDFNEWSENVTARQHVPSRSLRRDADHATAASVTCGFLQSNHRVILNTVIHSTKSNDFNDPNPKSAVLNDRPIQCS